MPDEVDKFEWNKRQQTKHDGRAVARWPQSGIYKGSPRNIGDESLRAQ